MAGALSYVKRTAWLLPILLHVLFSPGGAHAARPWLLWGSSTKSSLRKLTTPTSATASGAPSDSPWLISNRFAGSVEAPRVVFAAPSSRKQAVGGFWYLPGAAPALLREMQAEMFSTAAALGLVSNGERGNSGNLDLARNTQSRVNTALQAFDIPGIGLLGRRLLERYTHRIADISHNRRSGTVVWGGRLKVDTGVLDSSSESSRKQVGPNAGMAAYAQSANVGSINNQNTVNDQTADATKTGPGTPGVIATPYSQYQRRGATAYQTNTQSQTATTNGITPTYQFGSTSATNTITAVGGGTGGLAGYGGGLGGIAALGGGAALDTLSGAGVPFVTSLGGSALTSVNPVGEGVKCASQFDGGGCTQEEFLPAAHASGRPIEVISEIGTMAE